MKRSHYRYIRFIFSIVIASLLALIVGSGTTLAAPRQTAGQVIATVTPVGPLDTLFAFVHDPTILFLLFVVAMVGFLLEIAHPGVSLPGIIGAIALLLFFVGVGSVSPNWIGLALMVGAFVLLILDVHLPTYGVLSLGAVIALVVGTLLFFNSNGPQIDPLVVYIMSGIVGCIGLLIVMYAIKVQRTAIKTGIEGMVGTRVVALTPLQPEGRVRYGGEDWAAVLDRPGTVVAAGSEVVVVGVEGLRIHVVPLQNSLQRRLHD